MACGGGVVETPEAFRRLKEWGAKLGSRTRLEGTGSRALWMAPLACLLPHADRVLSPPQARMLEAWWFTLTATLTTL